MAASDGAERQLELPDLEWICKNDQEHIRESNFAKEAERLMKDLRTLTPEEIAAIVNAVGEGGAGWYQGTHWNTCPNGHLYVIGDCGGAMVQSKCPDCGALVGGQNHHLASGSANVRSVDDVVSRVVRAEGTATARAATAVAASVAPAPSSANVIAAQNVEYEAALLQDRRAVQAAAAPPAPAAVRVAVAMPPEPAIGDDVIVLRVRLPGSVASRRFRQTARAWEVAEWVQAAARAAGETLPREWMVVVDRPRRVIRIDSTETLAGLGITQSETMTVEEL